MGLSSELVSQFAKIVNTKNESENKKETIVYGKAIVDGGVTYVQIDGSDLWTPVKTTTAVKSTDKDNGERVTVLLKDHTATIIGNTSAPAARADDVEKQGQKIDEFDIVVAHKVTTDDLSAVNAIITNLKAITGNYEDLTAINALIETLESEFGNIRYLTAEDVTAITANIESLNTMFLNSKVISTEHITAATAELDNLVAHTATFTYVSTELLKAYNADIGTLNTQKLSTTDAELQYANIDFSNISKAAMEYFYSKSGLIDSVVIGDATIAGQLVGVTISGDLIEGNTIKADKLVIRGVDGVYYKLNVNADGTVPEVENVDDLQNGLHGSHIIARSIIAEKITVPDLVAFDATIGGFTITDKAIYSEVKEDVTNTTRGIYLDSDGQVNIGDSNNFIKYARDPSNLLDGQRNVALLVDWIDNGDGSYTLITNETDFGKPLGGAIIYYNEPLEAGSYILSGCPVGGKFKVWGLSDGDITDEPLYEGVDGQSLTFSLPETRTVVISANISDETYLGKEVVFTPHLQHAEYQLVISAKDVRYMLNGSPHSLVDLGRIGEYVNITTHEGEPCIELGESDSDFKLLITNTRMLFMEGAHVIAYVRKDALNIDKAIIERELQIGEDQNEKGSFVWKMRANGNLGLSWKPKVEVR